MLLFGVLVEGAGIEPAPNHCKLLTLLTFSHLEEPSVSSTQPQASSIVFEPGSGETWRGPFPMYRALRDHDPVHRFELDEAEFWALTRFKDVFGAAVDPKTFSSAQGLTLLYGDMEKLELESPIVMMAPPDHTALRKLAIKRFTPKQHFLHHVQTDQ